MYRGVGGRHDIRSESPHRRGDVPNRSVSSWTRSRISPQAWGCTEKTTRGLFMLSNLPTGVGMYRTPSWWLTSQRESPHRRGDVPRLLCLNATFHTISPQAWGCTLRVAHHSYFSTNLPTGVGMYRFYRGHNNSAKKSPHRRGDVPVSNEIEAMSNPISPQAWGCTV